MDTLCGIDRVYKHRTRVPALGLMEDFTMKYFLGLDLAKDSFCAAVLDHDGQRLGQRKFTNDGAGFAELIAWLTDPTQTLAVCEPTGAYGKKLEKFLVSLLGSLHVINAQTLRQFAFSQVQTKTDEADAWRIAEAARTLFLSKPKTLQNSRVSSNAGRDNLALWVGEYDRLRKAIVALRNQIKILDHEPAGDVARVRTLRQQELQRLLQQQKAVTVEIERVYRELDDQQAQLVDSIPGIGTITTAVTLVVVRDVDRFASTDALKAYLGAYPSRRQSGTREAPAHQARHGNKLMRHVLWNAAKAAVWHKHPQNPFRILFDRLIAKGKAYGCAIGAVVRKLVQTIYGVLKHQTPFRYPGPNP